MAIVAMSMGWYDRMLNLVTIFTFFGILYYGFIGKDAVEIKEKGHSNIFLLAKLSPSILRFKRFFDFNQKHISHVGREFIFHLVDIENWEVQLEKENYTAESLDKEGFIHASNAEQVVETYQRYYADRESMVLLTIVPKYITSRLEYDLNSVRNEYFPHIYGPLNKTAIVRLQYFSSANDSISIEG